MARPKIDDDERRASWLKFRASEAERDAIESRRAASGLSFSAYARQMLTEGAVITREPLADKALLRALAAIGNNLNQIARRANVRGEMDDDLSSRLDGPLLHLEGLIERLSGDC